MPADIYLNGSDNPFKKSICSSWNFALERYLDFWIVRFRRRGIIVYIEYQSGCPFVGIGSPHPLPRTRVCIPPWNHRGEEQHSLAGERLGGTQFGQLHGKKAWHSVYSVGLGIHRRQTETCYCRGGTLYNLLFLLVRGGGGEGWRNTFSVCTLFERALYFAAEDTFTHAWLAQAGLANPCKNFLLKKSGRLAQDKPGAGFRANQAEKRCFRIL